MKISYRHYRIPADYWKRKGDPPKKGKPLPLGLGRYMRGVTKWKPHERGGMTVCRISDDAGQVIARGQIVCLMGDNFCYREGRERALQNTYENMGEKWGKRIMAHWQISSSAVCPDCEKSRKELEKSFEAAFAGQEWRKQKTHLENVGLDVKVDTTEFKKGLSKAVVALQSVKDAQMRVSLLQILYDKANQIFEPSGSIRSTFTKPPNLIARMTDDQVREELRRILGIQVEG